jgi:hypothetical protein
VTSEGKSGMLRSYEGIGRKMLHERGSKSLQPPKSQAIHQNKTKMGAKMTKWQQNDPKKPVFLLKSELLKIAEDGNLIIVREYVQNPLFRDWFFYNKLGFFRQKRF